MSYNKPTRNVVWRWIVIVAVMLFGLSIAGPMAAKAAGPSYVAVAPSRLLDTRGGGPVGSGGVVEVPVLGRAGVPAGGVDAVFVNVTAVNASANGFLTLWPSGGQRPTASTLNFGAGATVANGALARLGTGGTISVYASAGTNILVDVEGYVPSGSALTAVAPARLLDSRNGGVTVDGRLAGGGAVPGGGSVAVEVTGRGGVPATGVSGVFVNVVAVQASDGGFVTTWPTGTTMPDASTLNFAAGQTVANNAFVGVGSGGRISLSASADTDLIVDVVGYVTTGAAPTPALPARIYDSRLFGRTVDGLGAAGGGPRSGASVDVVVAGRGGVPVSGVGAVIANITAVTPGGAGYLSAWATGQQPAGASLLNFAAHSGAVANGAIIPVGDDGRITIFAQTATQVLVDVVGWLPGSFPTPTRLSGLNVAPYIGKPALKVTENMLDERMDRVLPYTDWIRTYQCDGFARMATRAHAAGRKVAMGAWLDKSSAAGNRIEIDCLIAQAKAGNVDVAIVGSESLKSGRLPLGQVVAYLREVRAAIPASIPVTTAEPDPVWFANRSLFAEVDQVYANVYPFFASSPVQGAVAHLAGTYDLLKAAAPGKPIVISETGWPTCGPAFGPAIPSGENAAAYLQGFAAWAKAGSVQYFYLEAYDMAFKASHPGATEGCWGIWSEGGVMKPGMRAAFG